MQPLRDALQSELARLDPADPQYAAQAVERLLAAGRAAGASDIHLQPAADALEIRFRLDGVLQAVGRLPLALAPNVVARLKVLADLLTYRTEIPQEGRIRQDRGCPNFRGHQGTVPIFVAGGHKNGTVPLKQPDGEMRLSTFPTLHGERAVVRFFGRGGRYERLDELGLPEDIHAALGRLLGETAGAVLVTGPAGSGKTTTAYACLRALVRQGGQRSLVSLEDPIEVAVPGVAQSQVNLPVGLDLATGLRFWMRQDPEVILVGEIRDRATAEAAFQASLTGHLLLSTFHAGSAAEALGRLLDMGIEPYVLRSSLLAILSQRLPRRLCACARPSDDPADRLGLPIRRAMLPVGCPACAGTGYLGRFLLVEMLSLRGEACAGVPGGAELGRALLARADTAVLESLAVRGGMTSRWRRAVEAAEAGLTSPAEVRRLLGLGAVPAMS
jgi:type II secretory ATPase GspE/PulE/Tfp pilus assembly ATPase PilB-like protein